jgi:hypothetical protein
MSTQQPPTDPTPKHVACIVLSIVFATMLLFYVVLALRCEQFATRREKAAAIYEAVNDSNPSYNQYKQALGNKSNIVEYEDVMDLKHGGNFTLSNIEQII